MADTFVLAISDLHVGSTVGLCPKEGIKLEDGGVYRQSPQQAAIWEFYEELLALASSWSIGRDSRRIGVLLGEPVDGVHHGSTQLVTNSDTVMVQAALDVLAPFRDWASDVFMIKGTAAHSRGGGQAELLVGRELEATLCEDTRQPAFYHLELEADGVRLDLAHHVGNDGSPWTRGSAIRREVVKHLLECQELGERPADVLVRGHVHQHSDTGSNFRTWGVVIPGWQAKTEFTHRISRTPLSQVGGLLLHIANGQIKRKQVFVRTLRQMPRVRLTSPI